MKTTLLGLLLAVSTMGATAARADWNQGGRGGRAGRGGHYEPQTTQVWVQGQAQQVWQPGRCWRSSWAPPRCAPGHYSTVVSPGHYETRTEWVWVSHRRGPAFGLHVTSPGGHVALAVGPFPR